ncbi:GNAT family N-acetyltransferase [Halorubellus litoreus]|uniref:GNAT family N-acetyltransferase n=1 Tax=Halorubellus litoreus TaxID=755308 RepID=A0ABD5VF32_9EURY
MASRSLVSALRAVAGRVAVGFGRLLGVRHEAMCVYATSLEEGTVATRLPPGVEVDVERVGDVSNLPASAATDAAPSDFVAVARDTADGTPGGVLGWAFARVDAPVRVGECVRPLAFEGAYVWGLFVEPAVRGDGVGTALVTTLTARVARDRTGAAFALVGRSNASSRAVFERVGFECVAETTRLAVLGRHPPTGLVLGTRTYREPR